MKIQTTKVFKFLQNSKNRISVMQGGSRCFIGSTLVNTINGYVPIIEIKQGDEVYSYNEKSKKICTNRVINKFIYEVEQPLIKLNLENGESITCTPRHRFLYQKSWITAIELTRGVMERNIWDKWKISDKQFRENKNQKLQDDETRKNNVSSFLNKKSFKKQRLLFKDYDFEEWEVWNSIYSQISSSSIYTESEEQTPSKPYKWENLGQSSRKFRVGDTFRKFFTFIQNRFTNAQEKGIEWYGKTNRKTSKRNSNKICASENNCKNVSERVQCITMHNKDNSRSEQQKNEMARSHFRYQNQNFKEIDLDEIKSFEIYLSKEKVYDIEVENTHSYIITENNVIVHNSGKTYNISLWFIMKLLQEENKVLTVARLTLPSLKNTVFRDYRQILIDLGRWDENNFKASEMTYKLGSNLLEFRNLDDDMKIRGAKRHYLHLNEANEIPKDIFMQLLFRTESKIVMDYNPSDEFHWIYDDVIPRPDADFLKTTYKDNPFLPQELVKEIERLKDTDENYWRIYGLGEKGINETSIYTNYELVDYIPETNGEVFYGLDFGFNHPTALTRVKLIDGIAYAEELLYKSQLTNQDILRELKNLNIGPSETIFADCARPEMIAEIFNAGYNIHPTRKGKDSVKDGIDYVKRQKLKVVKSSLNLIKELRSYKWKVDKDGRVLDEPVKVNDDAVDSLRYCFNEKIQFGTEQFAVIEDFTF